MAIGAVLTRMHEDGEHPVVYISRVLTAQEQNYSATERECLALLWAIKRLRPFLEGYKFTAITKHSSLKWLSNLKEPNGWLARWALELQQWNFDVIYRKVSLNHVSDALSRISYKEMAENDEGSDMDYISTLEEIKDLWYLRRIQDVVQTRWNRQDNFSILHRSHPDISKA